MKELWFIFLIGFGLAIIRFLYKLALKFKFNRRKRNKNFSRILQTYKTRNIQSQKTFARGDKRISLFQELKKNENFSKNLIFFV